MGYALITGASAGLGVDFARLFAQDKHDLILVARRRDRMEALAQELKQKHPGLKVEVIDADLGLIGAGQTLYDTVKKRGLEVEFLVNNAGFGTNGALAKLPLAKELQMLDLNIRTLVELTHLFLPDMLTRKNGYILNVGSTAAFQPGPFMTNYYASKAFVTSFSEGLHEEIKGSGVSCTVLAPGATATEFAQTADMTFSKLFRFGGVANSESVARCGYRAMKKRKALAIAGLKNNIQVFLLRITPRSLARKIAGFLNGTVR